MLSGDEADKEVDDLIKSCKNHHNGEGLTESPCVVNLDYTAMLRRVSLNLDHGQCA